MPTDLRAQDVVDHVRNGWHRDVLELLDAFARIPNVSPAYDARWESAGHMESAVQLLATWARGRGIPGAEVDVVRLPGLTPTVLIDVPASSPDTGGTVLVYGHYDKQPPLEGWSAGRGPWSPVVEGDRLYARGVADDGYALPAAVLAIEALAGAGGGHGRCIVLAEGSEESGSPHLPAVLDHLGQRLGAPELVVALDSGCPTFDRLWTTTSLRGAVIGTLTVRVLDHGVHSGSAGSVVPSSFRICRLLLDRIEDAATGDLVLPELQADPPPEAVASAHALADAVAGSGVDDAFPVVGGLVVQGSSTSERALRTAWRGALGVVGAAGLPSAEEAGAVLRPFTTLKLAIRLPPTCDAGVAAEAIERAFTTDPPHGATVEWVLGQAASGWAAPPPAPWLADALDEASLACFGRPSGQVGEGGTIPFMRWLSDRFPDAQLLATGVLGPGSNAHGPDECLHLPTAERLTAALAMLLHAHGGRWRDT